MPEIDIARNIVQARCQFELSSNSKLIFCNWYHTNNRINECNSEFKNWELRWRPNYMHCKCDITRISTTNDIPWFLGLFLLSLSRAPPRETKCRRYRCTAKRVLCQSNATERPLTNMQPNLLLHYRPKTHFVLKRSWWRCRKTGVSRPNNTLRFPLFFMHLQNAFALLLLSA